MSDPRELAERCPHCGRGFNGIPHDIQAECLPTLKHDAQRYKGDYSEHVRVNAELADKLERLREAVNASCSCGGNEPGPHACEACWVWHRMQGNA